MGVAVHASVVPSLTIGSLSKQLALRGRIIRAFCVGGAPGWSSASRVQHPPAQLIVHAFTMSVQLTHARLSGCRLHDLTSTSQTKATGAASGLRTARSLQHRVDGCEAAASDIKTKRGGSSTASRDQDCESESSSRWLSLLVRPAPTSMTCLCW